jgi:hypothetical protein
MLLNKGHERPSCNVLHGDGHARPPWNFSLKIKRQCPAELIASTRTRPTVVDLVIIEGAVQLTKYAPEIEGVVFAGIAIALTHEVQINLIADINRPRLREAAPATANKKAAEGADGIFAEGRHGLR